MSIPNSIDTLKAAQGIAHELVSREKVLIGITAESCASDAMYMLGFAVPLASAEWHKDPLLHKLLEACESYVRIEAKARRANR